MGITLFDLTAGMQKIQAIIESGDDPDTWTDQLEDIDFQIEQKVINIGKVYRNQMAESQVYIDEGKRLAKKGKSMQDGAERLRQYAEIGMELAGLTEIKDGTMVAKFKKLPNKVGENIDIDMELLDEKYKRTIPEEIELDKKAIMDDFKEGIKTGVDILTGRTTLEFK